MKDIFFWLDPRAPKLLVYMLQQFEYDTLKLFSWWFFETNFLRVKKRGQLDFTLRARASLLVVYAAWAVTIGAGTVGGISSGRIFPFLILFVFANFFALVALIIFNPLFQIIVVNPREAKEIKRAKNKLRDMKAVKVAVLGSYGKTSMKDMLQTVLGESKNVHATPGNKNVLISHARWINNIDKNTEVLVFEYGEGAPGDIAKLASFSEPDIAVVTGVAPAHMDRYKSLEEIILDFATISQFVKPDKTYVNGADDLLRQKFQTCNIYQGDRIGELVASNVKITFNGTSMTVKDRHSSVEFHSSLLGIHQVAPLLAVVAIAKKIGLQQADIVRGVAKTAPFEHRMQPRNIGGAWLIDDTYNGNIIGMQAGLDLLTRLPATRRIYVTPGLVDQGEETIDIHLGLGQKIANSKPDIVVLMRNSVTDYIRQGLDGGGFVGELQIVDNPLEYYINLEHFVVAGDVVMMQNDWPDSYK